MQWIPGGTFRMGSDRHYAEEAPTRLVAVSGFWIDVHAVTNAEFAAFVDATGYRTFAERPLDPAAYPFVEPSQLVPGSAVFFSPTAAAEVEDVRSRWAYVPGANWRHPEGATSTLEGRERHPVVHVVFEDAIAYAGWVGKDLPTEAEWEFAARRSVLFRPTATASTTWPAMSGNGPPTGMPPASRAEPLRRAASRSIRAAPRKL